MKKIESKDLYNKKWSGGMTKELFIYPEKSNYNLRDFDFRISSATIEVEESQFTSLPKYNRILMVLKGSLDIIHKDQYQIHLNEFDIDKFSGAWETKSYGKVTDFNLMTSSKCYGNIKYMKINKKTISIKNDCEILVYYCYNGKGSINNVSINTGDIMVFDLNDQFNIEIISNSNSLVLIKSTIGYL
ncbi:MAG: HutD family protein [Bacillota bacterium]|nr:HutD family protein [Bacillota bacterium]